MSKKLQKSLQDYLSKFKRPTPHLQFPSNSFSSASKSWILSGCKYPVRTLSFAIDRNQDIKAGNNNEDDVDNSEAATLSDVDRFLFENFKSLYVIDDEVNYDGKKGKESREGENPSTAVSFGSPRFMDPPPDLCGSHRFFFTPGLSSSLIEESRTSVATTSEDAGSSSTTSTTTLNDSATTTNDHAKDVVALPDGCVAVLAYSPSPYEEFRRSMQEMVEARMRNHGKVDWNFMEELLFCYLNLNEKQSHRYILSAFVDLVVVLRQTSDSVPARSRNARNVRIPERERRRKRREK